MESLTDDLYDRETDIFREVNNSNNGKMAKEMLWGGGRDKVSTSQGDCPHNLIRLSVEAAAVRCTLGEILYALEKRLVRHVPSSPVVSGLYIASFRGGGGGGSDKGGGRKRDDNDNHDDK